MSLFSASMLALFAGAACAQNAVKIDGMEVAEHRIGHLRWIHSKVQIPFGQIDHVTLQVAVNARGDVESALPVSGPKEFFSEAESIELNRKFKPFERNGVAVAASITDEIWIFPPEQWADTDVPFPEIADWSTLKISLKRTICFGACPAYSVVVQGSGDVEFDGGSGSRITGHHHGQVTRKTVEGLVEEFRRVNYFSLKDAYVTSVTDNPTYTTSIEFDGKKKAVRDYAGLRAGMPEAVTELEDAIDEALGTEKWVKGNGETAAALKAEKWDFRAKTEENIALFADLIEQGSKDAIQLFVANGAPALELTKHGKGPLISAAEKGDLDLVKTLLEKDKQAEPPTALLTCALGAAAHSGVLPLVQFLIEKGAKPNGQLCGRYEKRTVLMEAAESGKSEVVEEILKYHPDVNAKGGNGSTALAVFLSRVPADGETQKTISLLLAAGADMNSRDQSGRTPIFNACVSGNSGAIHALSAAGADLNAKDRNGRTAIMSCFDTKALQAMIDDGADLTIRDEQGRTALEAARQQGFQEKIEFLEKAMKQPGEKGNDKVPPRGPN